MAGLSRHVDDSAQEALNYREKKNRERVLEQKVIDARRKLLQAESALFNRNQEMNRLRVEKSRIQTRLNQLRSKKGSHTARLNTDERKLKEHEQKLAILQRKAAEVGTFLQKDSENEAKLMRKLKQAFDKEKKEFDVANAKLQQTQRQLEDLKAEARRIQLEYSRKIENAQQGLAHEQITANREEREFNRASRDLEKHGTDPDMMQETSKEKQKTLERDLQTENTEIDRLRSVVEHDQEQVQDSEEEVRKLDTHSHGLESSATKIANDIRLEERHVADFRKELQAAEQELRNAA